MALMNGFSSTPNIPRGNTRDPAYRNIVQLYEFEKIRRWTRRDITPNDIDGRYYIHSGYWKGKKTKTQDSFLFFEFKTVGTKMQQGQADAIDALCRNLREQACFFFAEHPRLAVVDIPVDILSFCIRRYDRAAGQIMQTPPISNKVEIRIGQWIEQWFHHAEGTAANWFITEFRKLTGIYKFRKDN